MGTGLTHRQEPGLGLNRAGAGQQFPMVLAGHQRERGWQHDDVCTLVCQLPEEFGEADIVADGAADSRFANLVGHHFLAARDGIGFAVDHSAGDLHVEQVDLAIPGDLCAIGTEHHGGIVEGISFALRHAAGVDNHLQLPREAGHELVGIAIRKGLGSLLHLGGGIAEESVIFRQNHEIGPLGGDGLLDKRGGSGKVRCLLALRIHLDQRNSHAPSPSVPGKESRRGHVRQTRNNCLALQAMLMRWTQAACAQSMCGTRPASVCAAAAIAAAM